MKIQVMHDSAGNILSIFAPAEGQRRGSMTSPDAALTVSDVDAPDLTMPAESESDDSFSNALISLMQENRIESGRLVRRSDKSAS